MDRTGAVIVWSRLWQTHRTCVAFGAQRPWRNRRYALGSLLAEERDVNGSPTRPPISWIPTCIT